MLATLWKLTREQTAKINLAVDLSLLALSCAIATSTSTSFVTMVGAATIAFGTAVWLAGSRVLRRYDTSRPIGRRNDVALTSLLVLAVVATLLVLRMISPVPSGSLRPFELLRVFWPTVILARLAIRTGPYLSSAPPAEILVVGAGPLGRHTGLELVLAGGNRCVCGYLTFPGDVPDGRLPAQVLGSDADLDRVLRTRPVDEVYVAGNLRRHGEEMQSVVQTCERFGVPFAIPASHLRLERARPATRAIADGYVHYLTIEPKPYQLAIKRLFDIGASAFALLMLSPLLFGIALAIKLTSRGPVLFRQERVGQHGRSFRMLKFRSMIIDAESQRDHLLSKNEQTGPVFKIRNDPRITSIGRIIRKYSLDELPQLVNVLRGEMAIVGPRPPIPSEVARYEPWQRRRLSVRPGLTCLWQVSGRNEISFERWMYLDMQYIDHWSLVRDIQLILKTFPIVFTGRGAS